MGQKSAGGSPVDQDAARVKWALDFTRLDLQKESLSSLRSSLLAFFQQPGTTVGTSYSTIATPLEQPLPQGFSIEDFSRLQADVRTVFDHLHAHDYTPLPFRLSMVLTESKSFGSQLLVQGPTRDCTLFLLYMAIVNKPVGTIRRCPEAACGHRPFYRYRRQRFCSTTCTTRAMQRTWREKNRKKAAERQRKKYEAKRKRQLGVNVKITRKGGTR